SSTFLQPATLKLSLKSIMFSSGWSGPRDKTTVVWFKKWLIFFISPGRYSFSHLEHQHTIACLSVSGTGRRRWVTVIIFCSLPSTTFIGWQIMHHTFFFLRMSAPRNSVLDCTETIDPYGAEIFFFSAAVRRSPG